MHYKFDLWTSLVLLIVHIFVSYYDKSNFLMFRMAEYDLTSKMAKYYDNQLMLTFFEFHEAKGVTNLLVFVVFGILLLKDVRL